MKKVSQTSRKTADQKCSQSCLVAAKKSFHLRHSNPSSDSPAYRQDWNQDIIVSADILAPNKPKTPAGALLTEHDSARFYEAARHIENQTGPRFNINMSSYQYRKHHCGDKTVIRSSYPNMNFILKL